jgi:hypothetical protein
LGFLDPGVAASLSLPDKESGPFFSGDSESYLPIVLDENLFFIARFNLDLISSCLCYMSGTASFFYEL